MKVEMKPVTIEKEIYTCSDGAEYDEYEAALYHEFDYFVSVGRIKLFTERGIKANVERAEVCYIADEEALEIFVKDNEYEGYSYEGVRIGWNLWDGAFWESPQERLNTYREEINKILENCGGELVE